VGDSGVTRLPWYPTNTLRQRMSSLKNDPSTVKYRITVGRAENGWICVGIQDGRSWASDMFRIEDLDGAVEQLGRRLGKTAKVPKGTGRFGDVE